MTVVELVKNVKKGVKLLDQRVPNWRQIMRKHAAEYNFTDGSSCVLGTLEHHSGRMKVLKKRSREIYGDGYIAAVDILKLDRGCHYGFDGDNRYYNSLLPTGMTYKAQIDLLSDLWRAEFEK